MDRNEVSHADWHRIDIVAALHKEGVTMRDLSTQAGLKPDTLKNALARSYPKGERIIAAALGIHPQDIWPSRYLSRVLG
ncbi:helix-turn-helix domain-containing protein [Morganella psychrotolerans]|uniref:Transcriptional regulator n=1 Tax=Morganella psychrotolerans TaxID=368603 RepID=A0A1B8HRH7_9GAMM|nr:helix-turn-helix domain-containing protein [Morganella psychrotolerans]OBU12242.1 transcriptional regulator [Morganella psychrotolerans]